MRLRIHHLFSLLVLCLSFSQCIGTQPATTQTKEDTNQPAFRELAELLRKEPGVDVKGNSPNYSVTIRRKKTFKTSSSRQ